MSRPKALSLFLLLGLGYPASLFGWGRESIFEMRLGPLEVLWAFAVGFGGLAVFMNIKRGGLSRKVTVAILLLAYGASGALWAMGPDAGAGSVAALLTAGVVLLAAIWTIAFAGASAVTGRIGSGHRLALPRN
jgi:hypothetical protein